MNTKAKLYTIFFAISSFFMVSCQNDLDFHKDSRGDVLIADNSPNSSSISSSCFNERKSMATLNNQMGTVTLIDAQYDIYVIVNDDQTYNWLDACSLPNEYRVNGKRIMFSGIVMETLPTEKRIAAPFVLSYITTKE